MTHRDRYERVIICYTPEASCELCNRTAELRPYGPDGKQICFKCGMEKDEYAKGAFGRLIDGLREAKE